MSKYYIINRVRKLNSFDTYYFTFIIPKVYDLNDTLTAIRYFLMVNWILAHTMTWHKKSQHFINKRVHTLQFQKGEYTWYEKGLPHFIRKRVNTLLYTKGHNTSEPKGSLHLKFKRVNTLHSSLLFRKLIHEKVSILNTKRTREHAVTKRFIPVCW